MPVHIRGRARCTGSSSPHAREALVTVCESILAKQRPWRGQDPRGAACEFSASRLAEQRPRRGQDQKRASLDWPSSARGAARVRGVRV